MCGVCVCVCTVGLINTCTYGITGQLHGCLIGKFMQPSVVTCLNEDTAAQTEGRQWSGLVVSV